MQPGALFLSLRLSSSLVGLPRGAFRQPLRSSSSSGPRRPGLRSRRRALGRLGARPGAADGQGPAEGAEDAAARCAAAANQAVIVPVIAITTVLAALSAIVLVVVVVVVRPRRDMLPTQLVPRGDKVPLVLGKVRLAARGIILGFEARDEREVGLVGGEGGEEGAAGGGEAGGVRGGPGGEGGEDGALRAGSLEGQHATGMRTREDLLGKSGEWSMQVRNDRETHLEVVGEALASAGFADC